MQLYSDRNLKNDCLELLLDWLSRRDALLRSRDNLATTHPHKWTETSLPERCYCRVTAWPFGHAVCVLWCIPWRYRDRDRHVVVLSDSLFRRPRGTPPLIWKVTRAVQRFASTVAFSAAIIATVFQGFVWKLHCEFLQHYGRRVASKRSTGTMFCRANAYSSCINASSLFPGVPCYEACLPCAGQRECPLRWQ